MAPLFSKVDSNKLWHDVQHEETVIYAQSGKDLFNISKVIGRKKVAQFFWLTVYKQRTAEHNRLRQTVMRKHSPGMYMHTQHSKKERQLLKTRLFAEY